VQQLLAAGPLERRPPRRVQVGLRPRRDPGRREILPAQLEVHQRLDDCVPVLEVALAGLPRDEDRDLG